MEGKCKDLWAETVRAGDGEVFWGENGICWCSSDLASYTCSWLLLEVLN